jgi:hypothetical protein
VGNTNNFWYTNLKFSLRSNKQLLAGIDFISNCTQSSDKHLIYAFATNESDPLYLICSQNLHISADLNVRVPQI